MKTLQEFRESKKRVSVREYNSEFGQILDLDDYDEPCSVLVYGERGAHIIDYGFGKDCCYLYIGCEEWDGPEYSLEFMEEKLYDWWKAEQV